MNARNNQDRAPLGAAVVYRQPVGWLMEVARLTIQVAACRLLPGLAFDASEPAISAGEKESGVQFITLSPELSPSGGSVPSCNVQPQCLHVLVATPSSSRCCESFADKLYRFLVGHCIEEQLPEHHGRPVYT